MSGSDGIAASLARLEMALESIDMALARPKPPVPAAPPLPEQGVADSSNAEIATRLDSLIDQLRTALSSPAS